MAHNAVIYGIPFDPRALFDPDDTGYVDWFEGLVEQVGRTRQRQHAEAEARANRAR